MDFYPVIGNHLCAPYDGEYYPAAITAIGLQKPKLSKKQISGTPVEIVNQEEKVRISPLSSILTSNTSNHHHHHHIVKAKERKRKREALASKSTAQDDNFGLSPWNGLEEEPGKEAEEEAEKEAEKEAGESEGSKEISKEIKELKALQERIAFLEERDKERDEKKRLKEEQLEGHLGVISPKYPDVKVEMERWAMFRIEKDLKKAAGELIKGVFTPEELALSSYSGKRKDRLDPSKTGAIIG